MPLFDATSITVQVIVFIEGTTQEFEIELLGVSTLGGLRDAIQARVGGRRPLDRMWVAFAAADMPPVQFGSTHTGSDDRKLNTLMYSAEQEGIVSVAALKLSYVEMREKRQREADDETIHGMSRMRL